jgi:hypothetical protein
MNQQRQQIVRRSLDKNINELETTIFLDADSCTSLGSQSTGMWSYFAHQIPSFNFGKTSILACQPLTTYGFKSDEDLIV